METGERTEGWRLALALAAGLSVGCSLRTEIGFAEPDGAGGAKDAGNAAGTATGGTATRGSGDGGTATGGGRSTSNLGNNAVGGSNAAGGSAAGGSAAGGSAAGGSGGGAYEGAEIVMLFDGSLESFRSWESVRNGAENPWKYNDDGTMTVASNAGDIQSTATFNDVSVYLEYKTPEITSPGGGQERGNSGVYLKGSYEAQILDTYGLPPTNDGCGSIYGISAPLVVACLAAEAWNTYEIDFEAQRCDDQGQKTANARFVEVRLNGVVVQKNVDVPRATQAGQSERCEPQGLLLQDHSSILPVTFGRIWAIPRD